MSGSAKLACPCSCHRDERIGCRCCWPKAKMPTAAEVEAAVRSIGPRTLDAIMNLCDSPRWLKHRNER